MTERAEVDPVTFEIVRHKLFRIVDEALIALKNVSGTSVANEAHDVMVALYCADTSLLIGGVGYLYHLKGAAQALKYVVQHYSDDPGLFEGDTYLFNDAYSGALHTSDVYMLSPIHYGSKLIGFVGNFVHVADIGAIDPGGFSPRSEEVYQDGFASRGIKLVERGKVRKDVWETILNMVREPEMVALDFKSQIAANNVARMRMHDLMDEYGAGVVDAVGKRLIQQSEMLVRRRLSELPDGAWRARQYIDIPGKTYTFVLTMRKKDDTLVFDFTGSSGQASVGINSSYWGTWGGLCGALFPLLAYDITWNEGVTRPIDLIAPEGTVVNPIRPAPLSIATVTGIQTVCNLSSTCLSNMLGASAKYKEEATAIWYGTHAVVKIHGMSKEGRYFSSGITDAFAGAAGARSFKDGVDLGGEIGNMVARWANVETHEEDLPLLYLYRKVVKDSGGPGKYRGGVCHEYAYTPYDSPAHAIGLVACTKGVRVPTSTGIFGGYPGCTIDCIIFKGGISWKEALSKGLPFNVEMTTARDQEHVQWGVYLLNDGDILYVHYTGGGGYGDPIDREPNLVYQDVLAGLVSVECAKNIYGVIIDVETSSLNLPETARQRDLIREERLDGKKDRAMQASGGIRPTDLRMGEYLQVIPSGRGKFVQCTWCGNTLCSIEVNWKEEASMKEYSIARSGPFRPHNDQFFLREFYCPKCATLLDTEVYLQGDPPLHDEIYF